jgi:hypothetical protein
MENNESTPMDQIQRSTTERSNRRKSKPKSKPKLISKRPRNAYVHFLMDPKQKEKATQVDSQGSDSRKRMGEIWRNMNSEERQPYQDLYIKEKEVYEELIKIKEDDSFDEPPKEKKAIKKTSANTPERSKRRKKVKRDWTSKLRNDLISLDDSDSDYELD